MRLPFARLERAADAPPARARPPVVDLVLEDDPGGPIQLLGDLIAPAALSIATDHLVLDGQFARLLALVGLPPAADPGWLEPLVAAVLPTEVSLFVEPAELGATAGRLAHRHTRLQSSLGRDAGCCRRPPAGPGGPSATLATRDPVVIPELWHRHRLPVGCRAERSRVAGRAHDPAADQRQAWPVVAGHRTRAGGSCPGWCHRVDEQGGRAGATTAHPEPASHRVAEPPGCLRAAGLAGCDGSRTAPLAELGAPLVPNAPGAGRCQGGRPAGGAPAGRGDTGLEEP